MRIIIRFLLLAFIITSCSKVSNEPVWIHLKMYDDFLGVKYKPERIEKTFKFDFNADSQIAGSSVKIGLFNEETEGKYTLVSPDEVRIYKNNKLCTTNVFEVTSDESSAKIELDVQRGAPNGRNKWFFKVADTYQLDRIDDVDVANGREPLITSFVITKNETMNPLLLIIVLVLVLFLFALLLWKLLVQKIVYPRFKGGKLAISGEGYYKTINLKGARKLICTNQQYNQSVMDAFLRGKIIYEQNDFWNTEWSIYPQAKGRGLRQRGRNILLDPISREIKPGNEYQVTIIESEANLESLSAQNITVKYL